MTSEGVELRGHPHGVEPWGSRLLKRNEAGGGRADTRSAGLGSLACLDDALVLSVLGLLPGRDLARLSAVSRSLCCFANHEPLWKALAVEGLEDFAFSASWRQTYVRSSGHPEFRQAAPLQVRGLYSDVLYQSWHFAHTPLAAEWLEHDSIPRRGASQLTLQKFQEDFEVPNRPVIITGEVTNWPAFRKWTRQHLGKAFAGRRLNAGGTMLSYDIYLAYSANSRDELPLYLFDKQCLSWTQAGTSDSLADDYQVPEYFAEDLFSVMGDQRPDWRWLIVGPPKSGSSFHKDPNSTSAWNAVISGSKKWVLWPPHSPPPGVYPSADGLEVSSPYTLHEWFASFYEYAKEEPAMLEGICHAGELLFVPRGWWHLAINLEETIAVTQNHVSACNLPHVLRHLQNPTLVSGCGVEQRATLHDRFLDALRIHRPKVLEQLAQTEAAKKRKAAEERALSSLFGSVRAGSSEKCGGNAAAKFARLTGMIEDDGSTPAAGGFSFGFALNGA